MGGRKRASTVDQGTPPSTKRSPLSIPFHKLIRKSKSLPVGTEASHDGGQTESSSRAESPRPGSATSATTVPISNVTLSSDAGDPSPSALKDLHRVLRLIEDERHLVAHNLLLDAKRRIEESRGKSLLDRKNQIPKPDQTKRQRKRGGGILGGKGGRVAEDSNEEGSEIIYNEEQEALIFFEEKRAEFRKLEVRSNFFPEKCIKIFSYDQALSIHFFSFRCCFPCLESCNIVHKCKRKFVS